LVGKRLSASFFAGFARSRKGGTMVDRSPSAIDWHRGSAMEAGGFRRRFGMRPSSQAALSCAAAPAAQST